LEHFKNLNDANFTSANEVFFKTDFALLSIINI
jgi:hypothetical protein